MDGVDVSRLAIAKFSRDGKRTDMYFLSEEDGRIRISDHQELTDERDNSYVRQANGNSGFFSGSYPAGRVAFLRLNDGMDPAQPLSYLKDYFDHSGAGWGEVLGAETPETELDGSLNARGRDFWRASAVPDPGDGYDRVRFHGAMDGRSRGTRELCEAKYVYDLLGARLKEWMPEDEAGEFLSDLTGMTPEDYARYEAAYEEAGSSIAARYRSDIDEVRRSLVPTDRPVNIIGVMYEATYDTEDGPDEGHGYAVSFSLDMRDPANRALERDIPRLCAGDDFYGVGDQAAKGARIGASVSGFRASGWSGLDEIPKGLAMYGLPDGGILFSGKAFLDSDFELWDDGCAFEDGKRYDSLDIRHGAEILPSDYELSPAGWNEHCRLAAERFAERLPEDAADLREKASAYLSALPDAAEPAKAGTKEKPMEKAAERKPVYLDGVNPGLIRTLSAKTSDGRNFMMVAVADPASAPDRGRELGYGSFIVHPNCVRDSKSGKTKNVFLGMEGEPVKSYRIRTTDGEYVSVERTAEQVKAQYEDERAAWKAKQAEADKNGASKEASDKGLGG